MYEIRVMGEPAHKVVEGNTAISSRGIQFGVDEVTPVANRLVELDKLFLPLTVLVIAACMRVFCPAVNIT